MNSIFDITIYVRIIAMPTTYSLIKNRVGLLRTAKPVLVQGKRFDVTSVLENYPKVNTLIKFMT